MTLYFTWTRGTAADNMIKVLKQHNINCFYDGIGTLKATINNQVVTLDYKHVDGDKYMIGARKELNKTCLPLYTFTPIEF